MELVRFQSVRKDYGHRPILEDVSFRIGEGDKLGVIGANGAGKTTIVRLLLDVFEIATGRHILSTRWYDGATYFNQYTVFIIFGYRLTNLAMPD